MVRRLPMRKSPFLPVIIRAMWKRQNTKPIKTGAANFALLAGRDYLVDSVILRPLDGAIESGGEMWESIWASLTFQVPAKHKIGVKPK